MSKKIYNIAQLSITIQALFQKLNKHCFGGTLPTCLITFESGTKRHAYGWTYSEKMWTVGEGKQKYSIVLASEYLYDTQNVILTLVHEMCHIYAMENAIQDTSRHGYYHNDKFKEIAESAGLVCTKEKQGWATRNMTKGLAKFVEEQCKLEGICLKWRDETRTKETEPEPETGGDNQSREGEKPKKKAGYYKYKCPQCGATARTTKTKCILACCGTIDEAHEPQMMKIEN